METSVTLVKKVIFRFGVLSQRIRTNSALAYGTERRTFCRHSRMDGGEGDFCKSLCVKPLQSPVLLAVICNRHNTLLSQRLEPLAHPEPEAHQPLAEPPAEMRHWRTRRGSRSI
jgi:hypothetical protein